MKPRIKEVVVVEGKTDTEKLKKIFDVKTFETNGSDINNNKIELLKMINEKDGIILFLDPDITGKKIRSQILDKIPTAKNAYLSSDSRGVAEHKEIEIIEAFKSFFTQDKYKDDEITWNEYLDLKLNTKESRENLCKKLQIPYCNNKSLYKTINMIKKTKIEIQEIINSEDNKE